MKEKSAGNNRGFSTLEIMIAFALISIVLVGAIGGNFMAQYWNVTGQTANEGLYKAKTKLEDLRSLIKQDFYSAVSSPSTASVDPTDPKDLACIAGGLCYFVGNTVTDISSCSKYVETNVDWQVEGYPTTTTSLSTNLTNSLEIIARGGDCILNTPSGNWKNNSPQSVGMFTATPGKQFTGIDVLHEKIYATANTFPGFLAYNVPTAIGVNPIQIGSLDIKVGGVSKKINSLDVEEDLNTGRKYAFVAVHATTSQLAVIDVTDSNNPSMVTSVSLQNVDPFGSFPQGYRIFIYGARLYMTVRETSGTEFHIFDISTPTLPTEIGNGGNGFELNRTVENFVVRDQKISGVNHRLVFLASDSDLKEVSVLDVTGDSISELNSVDLPGSGDGYSVFLLGNKLYFGRALNPSGPELYVFDIRDPGSSLPILGQAEVGGNVTNIQVSSTYAYVGTSKSGEEFQVWDSSVTSWNPAILNAGRFRSYNMANLSPLGFDIDGNWVYAISQGVVSDKIQVLYTTP